MDYYTTKLITIESPVSQAFIDFAKELVARFKQN